MSESPATRGPTSWQGRLLLTAGNQNSKFLAQTTSSSRVLREKTSAFLEDSFLSKGKQFYSLYCKNNLPSQPWFARLSIPREQIVLITRLRSNHYNLNASLHGKNIIPSALCDCGDPHQDINHVIFLLRTDSTDGISFDILPSTPRPPCSDQHFLISSLTISQTLSSPYLLLEVFSNFNMNSS